MRRIFCISLFINMLAISGCATGPANPDGPGFILYAGATLGPTGDNWEELSAWLELMADSPAMHKSLVFEPGEYRLADAKGLRIPTNTTVEMTGATLVLDEAVNEDGQAFLVEDAANVRFVGGTIAGSRDAWPDSVNVAGIRMRGACDILAIESTVFRDLSSNAIGVFGSEERPITGVEVRNVTVTNCCNIYGDYLSDHSGPAEGSVREDQGGIALYHVNDWTVRNSVFDGSRSDGTHFYHSHRGRFDGNIVSNSQMGGYFLEGCEDVSAAGNTISDNGSRGVTIERNSRRCQLINNEISRSGREGLWAPDVEDIVVADNTFRENGQKDDGERESEIRLDEDEKYTVVTRNIRIEGNVFIATEHTHGVIHVSPGCENVSIQSNQFQGGVRTLALEGDVALMLNHGLDERN